LVKLGDLEEKDIITHVPGRDKGASTGHAGDRR